MAPAARSRQVARIWLACLLCGCMGGAAAADRNPRQGFRDVEYHKPPPVTDRAGMGEWLRRLADQYRVEGMLSVSMLAPEDISTLKGSGDCALVGEGPGVHCIFNIQWSDRFEVIMDPDIGPPGVYNVPGGVSYLDPSMMLMGMDPQRRGLQLLLVDNKGLPEGGVATIAGDRATLRTPCVNAPALFLAMNPDRKFEGRPPQSCQRTMRIDAKPGSTVVHLAIDIEINGELVTQMQMTLRRPRKDGRR